ncbi:MAG: cation:proton antiporter [Planctomycetaceae bacterium TMED241]|jgi:Kef-type K+ transport system membrane component KefB/nucleotide-binding universal stress UspA family protein|uniref:cation:proton antiporter domain-containing protein n=1 Tax=Synechococcales TaxID=1890424 RepID=UPI0004E07B54|nr:cation:proton antiporter [Synechococcus sp. KORDI-49]AII45555.1 sodium:proton antiporter [Synechococcus sp. KORDI-49]RCL53857.1 MAG: cation:proton antiporter [Synechococcus sp. MED-G70]RPG10799.1 MAG: cation:proton antiporter [Planctomycetaceae bacterium TMED241]|tara:strand:- start:1832 stop:3931 length:2100 start_codon:yes stop_codon:yes gene_type:complete
MAMEASVSHVMHHPLGVFALLVAISAAVPPLIRRLGLPDLVGLLLAGVLIGPHALQWVDTDSETVRLLSDLGAVYLLFTMGLEIDLEEFNRVKRRSFIYGLLILLIGVATGVSIGWMAGFAGVSCLLLGALMATHTPLGYPIVRSYGAQKDEAVVVSVGSTIFTDIVALLLLAVGLGLGKGDLSGAGLTWLLVKIGLFALMVVLGIRWLGQRLVIRGINDENRMVLAVLVALFLASLGAELAGVEKIVGAFLAGLAVNSVLPEGRVKEQVIFIGSVLFIPIFFIDLGLLLDVGSLGESLSNYQFTGLMLVGAIGGKGLASWISGALFGYRRSQILMMWSLTMPKVAATLATAFIGFQAGLLNQMVLNAVLAVMVVTATLGPILTERSVTRLTEDRQGMVPTSFGEEAATADGVSEVVQRPLRIVVPIANPGNEGGLLNIASRLLRGSAGGEGLLLPLAMVNPSLEEVRGGLNRAVVAARGRLAAAAAIGSSLQVPTRTLLRLDEDIAGGMSRTALEQSADLLLIGAGRADQLRAWFLGDIVDGVCRTAHCPVVVVNLGRQRVTALSRILVPIKDLSASAREQFELALRVINTAALEERTRITLLHVHDPRFSGQDRRWMEEQLIRWRPQGIPAERFHIVIVRGPGIDVAIHRLSREHDLVILRTQRRRVAGLPIPGSDRTSKLISQLPCAAMVISDPLV